jgi:CO/xanthine dehydrogenase Mo-binding subunit
MSRVTPKQVVGTRATRVDGVDMVVGAAIYAADQIPPRSVYVKTVRAGIPHAIIHSVDISEAKVQPGVLAVLTAQDVPGLNSCTTLTPDKPLFAYQKIRHSGDVVAAIVAESQVDAEEAASLVKISYEPLPVITSPLDAIKEGSVKIHDKGNIINHFKVRKGDIERGFRESEVILEHTYTTPCQEPAPLEPESAVATIEEGRIKIIGSMQNPHAVRDAVAVMMNMKSEEIRVIQAATGGTFGGKSDEIPMELAALAALASRRTGRSAAVIYSREESMAAHSHRHPFVMRYKCGATRDGLLKAVEADLFGDTGAYASVGALVMQRALYHSAGPYEVPNVKVDAYQVYTNSCIAGSFRGFGSPQVHFAAESMMDEMAAELKMDQLDFRLKNMLKPGKRTISDWQMDNSCGLPECIEKVVKDSDYARKTALYERQDGPVRKGIGIALMHHGNSLGPEGSDWATATVSIKNTHIVEFRTGLTEYGTGAPTGMVQIVADTLGIPVSWVARGAPDTGTCPDAGLTVASRSTMIGGEASRLAAEKVKDQLRKVASRILQCGEDRLMFSDGRVFNVDSPGSRIGFWELVDECHKSGVMLEEEGRYQAPDVKFDVETGQGQTYLQFTFGAVVVEVDVDLSTGYVTPTHVSAAYDVGKAINPMSLEGQIEGGTIQSLGLGLMEELVLQKGIIKNPNFADYFIPTSTDSPEIKSFIVEYPGPAGVFGAKAMGEPPIDAPHAALVNAIFNATGVRIRDLPATPERVIKGLKSVQPPQV